MRPRLVEAESPLEFSARGGNDGSKPICDFNCYLLGPPPCSVDTVLLTIDLVATDDQHQPVLEVNGPSFGSANTGVHIDAARDVWEDVYVWRRDNLDDCHARLGGTR